VWTASAVTRKFKVRLQFGRLARTIQVEGSPAVATYRGRGALVFAQESLLRAGMDAVAVCHPQGFLI